MVWLPALKLDLWRVAYRTVSIGWQPEEASDSRHGTWVTVRRQRFDLVFGHQADTS